MFDEVRNEIMAIGTDQIFTSQRTTDPRIELAVHLLNDAGMTLSIAILVFSIQIIMLGVNAYWSPSPYSVLDMIGLKVSF